MDVSNAVNLFLYLGLIAAMSQQLTEFTKKTFGLSNVDNWFKRLFVQLVAFAAACAGAYMIPPTGIFILEKLTGNYAIIVVGLLGAGGAGPWNDMLKLVTEYKKNLQIKSASLML